MAIECTAIYFRMQPFVRMGFCVGALKCGIIHCHGIRSFSPALLIWQTLVLLTWLLIMLLLMDLTPCIF